ncbi:hypothetical protein [Parvularcula dongshanensis]|uniref:Uncharacterized protein n=1 Tax=Parvularcula dongshanensis TaxID=1173995 RepID=A0A840I470_9PROT|nr:hypothetical protein [Parvularcula dongshanensis]MBB4658830.1 hypothetical protein [Parvularcula dongshanensis]
MEQTFISYVTTDTRFWLASNLAILRSLAIPAAFAGGGFFFVAGQAAVLPFALGLFLWLLLDWAFLVVRMARRIALGAEEPNDLLDRTVLGNARHLYTAYFKGPMPRLRTA